MMALTSAVVQARWGYAQTVAPGETATAESLTKVAALHEPAPAPDVPAAKAASAPAPESPADMAKELAAMKARIELLEAELKSRMSTTNTTTNTTTDASLAPVVPAQAAARPGVAAAQAMVAQPSGDTSTAESTKKEKIAPFSDWDWTWLNGNPRN
ncbi:MAG: hypothetical protein ABSD75_06110, partial [Terriglobales bacterium]